MSDEKKELKHEVERLLVKLDNIIFNKMPNDTPRINEAKTLLFDLEIILQDPNTLGIFRIRDSI